MLVNLDDIDLTKVEFSLEEVRRYVPQRYEMEQLGGVYALLPEQQLAVGWHDVREDAFWVRGHIPGRPLMPGVLMLEALAQLSTFVHKKISGDPPENFMGFGGLERVKFRATVVPGDRLILISKLIDARSRRWLFDAQGVVDGKLVVEAQIIGLRV